MRSFFYVHIPRQIFVRIMLRINLLFCHRRVINTVHQAGNTHFSEEKTIKTKMNLNGTTRKALVAAIADKATYRGVPPYNYDIGEITVSKYSSPAFPDGSDILNNLAAAAFFLEATESETEAPAGLTVSLPRAASPKIPSTTCRN